MKKILLTSSFLAVLCATSISSAATTTNNLRAQATGEQVQQVIQITNLLANTNSPHAGMTETRVQIDYDNGGKNPCWSEKPITEYQGSTSFRAGPTFGCKTKVYRVNITPIATAGKILAYSNYTVNIDTTKFVTQIIINQDQAPVFDPETGLVVTPGTIKVATQQQ